MNKKQTNKTSTIFIYSSPTRIHLPYPYLLIQQEYIFHIHIFFSNKNTSSIYIYSSPTRRHHIFFSNKKTPDILLQQENIFFSHKKTSPVSIQHIPCLHSRHMSLEHTHVSRAYTCLQSIHIESIRTRHGQNPKN